MYEDVSVDLVDRTGMVVDRSGVVVTGMSVVVYEVEVTISVEVKSELEVALLDVVSADNMLAVELESSSDTDVELLAT